MPLDFPLSPALNQVYSIGGKSWKWNGDAWETYNDNLGVDFVETVNGATGDVIITGGTDISVSTVGKTVTVNYTGSGGGGGNGTQTFTVGLTGITGVFYNGDRWINTDNGVKYTYTVVTGSTAGNAGAWVEYS